MVGICTIPYIQESSLSRIRPMAIATSSPLLIYPHSAIPWEKDVPFFLVSFLDPEKKTPVSVCPRGLLKKIEEQAERSGWQCLAGVEFEVCAPEAFGPYTANS